jgi:hypothetical protein
MLRVKYLFGCACLVALCCAGIWAAARPPLELALPSEATDLHLSATGWWEWRLTYLAPGAPYGWYVTIVHQLEEEGWMENREQYIGGPPHDPATYTRKTSFGYLIVWERVEIGGEPHLAELRMWRWISLAWRLPAFW